MPEVQTNQGNSLSNASRKVQSNNPIKSQLWKSLSCNCRAVSCHLSSHCWHTYSQLLKPHLDLWIKLFRFILCSSRTLYHYPGPSALIAKELWLPPLFFTKDLYPKLPSNSLGSHGRPWTSHPPVSNSQAWLIMPSLCSTEDQTLG